MNTIKAKPLSVNTAWKGKRFKTSDYKDYEQLMFYLLPKKLYIPKGKILLNITWGFSSKASDLDNCLKPFIDILQKCYGFNDKMIYKIVVEKVIVEKEQEFIKFELKDYE
jgi:Holliday junction resolvase RusA-like endonuclease